MRAKESTAYGASQASGGGLLPFQSGSQFEESGNFLNAVDEYKKAIQEDPQSPNLYIELANAYLRNRQLNNAIREAESAVRVDPESLEAHRLLGSIYYSIVRNEDSPRPGASLKRIPEKGDPGVRKDLQSG